MASAASVGSGAVRALFPLPWSTRTERPAGSRSLGKSASASETRSPERKSTARSARLRMPVGARREQAARRASTSARVRGSAGNRRAGFRFTRHQTVLEHVQCRFDQFPTLYRDPYRLAARRARKTTLGYADAAVPRIRRASVASAPVQAGPGHLSDTPMGHAAEPAIGARGAGLEGDTRPPLSRLRKRQEPTVLLRRLVGL